jgi:Ribosomal RNA adenine dimethylase
MNKQNLNYQALVGHLLDLYRLSTFKFVNPHSYTKFRQINQVRQETQSKVFVETGTYLGVTTRRCANFFDQLYTIEFDETLAKQAEQYLSSKKNVKVLQGDAVKVLPSLLSHEHLENALVFLDGHFSGGVTGCSDEPEPAIQELEILANYRHKINAIIIDDFRAFGVEPGFPTKSDLIKSIERHFPDASITVHLDQVLIKNKAAMAH